MFDASTIVAATLTPNGTPRRALITARLWGGIALSDQVFAEISNVLSRPKFARAIDDRRREIMELLSASAIWVVPTVAVADCRDAKDNKYLELAAAAEAAVIVSGDADLLVLDPWRGIRISTAAGFLASI